MDEIVVAQNKYISSKRASRLSGYAQDYIGQMVRMGKLPATKVGKSWFIDERALLSHINGSNRIESPAKDLALLSGKAQKYTSSVAAGISYPLTWAPIQYSTDDSALYPVSDSRDTTNSIGILSSGSKSFSEVGSVEPIKIAIKRKQSHVTAQTFDGVRFSAPSSTEIATSSSEIEHLYAEIDELRRTATHYRLGRYAPTGFAAGVLRALTASVLASVIIFLIPLIS